MTYPRQRGKHAVGSQTRQKLELMRSGLLVMALCGVAISIFAWTKLPYPLNSRDATGTLSTYSTAGGVDQANPFFKSLGTNGRTCASCHVASDAWSITPPDLLARFNSTEGLDPVYQPVDGANCPSNDVSTLEARQAAYSQLLNKGLIRISLPVPASAAFSITQIQDPYNCPQTTTSQPALYRRPLPSTNLDFLSAVMFDGRDPVKNLFGTIDLNASLTQQATDATLGHAQATAPPTSQQLAQIVSFETALYTPQANDVKAGSLNTQGGQGGPFSLSTQPFYIGINDALGGDPTGVQFNPNVFTIYNKWANLSSQSNRQAVARGQGLFNTLPIAITGVGGLNDALGQPVINGTCTTCHDSPNVGNH